ncbi:MAG: hypothetical protein AB7G93_09445 [Bdellovibrionales bacterium]
MILRSWIDSDLFGDGPRCLRVRFEAEVHADHVEWIECQAGITPISFETLSLTDQCQITELIRDFQQDLQRFDQPYTSWLEEVG